MQDCHEKGMGLCGVRAPLLDPVLDLLSTSSINHLAVRPALCMYVLASSGQSS